MIRAVDDPRVVEVLAAFDLACSPSPAGDEPNLIESFMDSVAGFCWTGWTAEAHQRVIQTCLVYAPDEDFETMLADAREWLAWRGDFALECEFETAGLGSCYSPGFKAWKQARLAEVSA